MAEVRLTEIDRAELNRIRDKVDNVRGPGVVNTRNTLSINGGTGVARRSTGSVFTLPKGVKYQVLMIIDDAGTWAADYPRMH